MQIEACGRGRAPFVMWLGVDDLPCRFCLPVLGGSFLAGSGEGNLAVIRQGIDPANAGISGRLAGDGVNLFPEVFGHEQTFELELLLFVPGIRRMRLQRADNATGCAHTGA